MQAHMTAQRTIEVNGAPIYHEVRGEGPAALLVPGLPGDAGQFEALAEALAATRRVVTYDRRGNSRSARPDGWTETSVREQSEDAAALLEALDAAPALVYGTSVGGIVALELAVARPELVSHVVLHELPLLTVLEDAEPVAAAIGGIVEPAFERGGPDGALDAFLRFAYGDEIVEGIDAAERARMLSNGAVAMTIELPVFQPYRPHEEALRALEARADLLVGREQQLPLFGEAAEWLARALGTVVTASPGAHGPQFDRPAELAECIEALAAAPRERGGRP